MNYCDTCARLHGWPTDCPNTLRDRCDVCGQPKRWWGCTTIYDRQATDLATPTVSEAEALHHWLGELRAAIEPAWHQFLRATGDYAAQVMRYEALHMLGWQTLPGMGPEPEEHLARLRQEADQKYRAWAMRLRCVAVLERLTAKETTT